MFLPVSAHPGSPGQRAIKRLLLLFLLTVNNCMVKLTYSYSVIITGSNAVYG